jgi:hypothetical protein
MGENMKFEMVIDVLELAELELPLVVGGALVFGPLLHAARSRAPATTRTPAPLLIRIARPPSMSG